MSDNGIKTVQFGTNPGTVVNAMEPKHLPPPAYKDNGRPLAPKTEISAVSNLHKVATEVAAEVAVVAPVTPEVPAVDEAAKRAKRKEEWTMAEKARQLDASANEKLSKAKDYEHALANFDKDPMLLARALNIPLSDLLIRLQNSAMGAPTEKVLSPEEQYKLKNMQYEQQMQALNKRQIELENNTARNNYLNTKIIPVLNKEPDKYELLHAEGMENSANFIYEYMNDWYGKTKQELNVTDVLEAFEEELTEKYSGKLNHFKNMKKFKDLFAQQAAAEAAAEGETPVKVIPKDVPALGAKETDLAKILPRAAAKKAEVTGGKDNTIIKSGANSSRESRLAAIRARREAETK